MKGKNKKSLVSIVSGQGTNKIAIFAQDIMTG